MLLGARSDRTGCDTDPVALPLLVHVRVQSFLLRSIGEHGVCGAAVDESNVTEDADVDVVHSEILEGARLTDVVEELGAVAGDTRKLRDEVFGEELAEAPGVAELVGVEEVLVELPENRQILGGLLGVVHVLVPSVCGSPGRLLSRSCIPQKQPPARIAFSVASVIGRSSSVERRTRATESSPDGIVRFNNVCFDSGKPTRAPVQQAAVLSRSRFCIARLG